MGFIPEFLGTSFLSFFLIEPGRPEAEQDSSPSSPRSPPGGAVYSIQLSVWLLSIATLGMLIVRRVIEMDCQRTIYLPFGIAFLLDYGLTLLDLLVGYAQFPVLTPRA